MRPSSELRASSFAHEASPINKKGQQSVTNLFSSSIFYENFYFFGCKITPNRKFSQGLFLLFLADFKAALEKPPQIALIIN